MQTEKLRLASVRRGPLCYEKLGKSMRPSPTGWKMRKNRTRMLSDPKVPAETAAHDLATGRFTCRFT